VSVVPSPWPVAHIHRYFSDEEDEHGNFPRVEDPPVIRWVMSIHQQRGLEIQAESHALQVSTALDMAVADPENYHADDHVLIDPALDDQGEYVPESGTLYWIDGDPSDERVGPWPGLLSMFGGVIKLKRVT
jgi:hypothetical protein